MVKLFIGVDISKDWIDFATFDSINLKAVAGERVKNDQKSIAKFLRTFKKEHPDLHVVFEHTGAYGLELALTLEHFEITYSVVPAYEIQMSIGLKRGKNDVIDACRIAEYACINSHKLKPFKLPSKILSKIKDLLTYRAQLTRIMAGLKNSLKAHKLNNKTSEMSFITKDIEKKIQAFDTDIDKIEKQVLDLIYSDPELNKNYGFITSVKGVGLIIAAYVIVSTGNFTLFTDPRKFNCYAGMAPFEHSSGSSIKGATKTSHLANKTLKTLLRNGDQSAMVYDPQLKKYKKRKLEEGKKPQVIANAVACKLVYRIFATVKRQSNFILLAN